MMQGQGPTQEASFETVLVFVMFHVQGADLQSKGIQ